MGKKETIMAVVFVAVIMGMCLTLSLGMIVFGPSQSLANETPVRVPELTDDAGFNFAVLSDVSHYVDSRFFGRAELISSGRRLSALVFGATDSTDVIVGSDGWLFYGETIDDYAGVNGLTDRELFSASENIRLMEEYCKSWDIDFVFTLAPNKNTLYPEHMCAGPTAGERDSQRLYELLDLVGVRYVDLSAAFDTVDETLYFAHDSHWTSRGAALAADELCRTMGRESQFFAGKFVPKQHSGDLYEMLYPGTTDMENDQVATEMPEFAYGDGGTLPESITINTECQTADGTLLCYRDSFGNNLYPYLASSFERARFSRSPTYDMTLAESLDAGTVVVELVERNIDYLLDYPPTVHAPERHVILPDKNSGEIRVYAANAQTEGMATISGLLPETPDDMSPVFISNGRAVYEAVLTREGFKALMPTGEGPWRVGFYVNGILTVYLAV